MKKLLLLIFLAVTLITSPASAVFQSDIIITSPNGIWTDSRAYTTLNDAIDAVGANERTIKIVSPQTVTTLTIPSNVTLSFERNGSITNSGQLTINTKNISAPNRQIFTGVGNIDFATGSTLKTGWFSNIETAFALTSNDEVTLIVSKPQNITADYSPGNDVHLKWENPGNILTINAGVEVTNINQIEAGDYQILAGSGDADFLDGTELNLNWFNRLRTIATWIEDEQVTIIVSGTKVVDFDATIPTNANLDFVSRQGQLSISAGITVTINGPVVYGQRQVFSGLGNAVFDTGSVNNINPKWWGAIGDGVTEDTTAMQSAFTAAYSAKVPVKFSPGTYLTDTINYYGQSIIGVVGAVPVHSYTPVTIKGKSSKDILRFPDPLDDATGRRQGMVIQDIRFLLDDSVDASASFPNRNGVGNACIAYPMRDGNTALWSGGYTAPLNSVFRRVFFDTVSATAQNKSCAIFFQNPPYNTVFQEVHIYRFEYGYWEEIPAANETLMLYASDVNQYIGCVFNGTKYPFQSYNASRSIINEMQVYGTTAGFVGPMFKQFASFGRSVCYFWQVNSLYYEGGDSTTGAIVVVEGENHVFIASTLKQGYSANSYVQWDADACTFINGQISSSGAAVGLKINGNQNDFSIRTKTNNTSAVEDNGTGNTVRVVGFDSIAEFGRSQMINISKKDFPFRRSADSLFTTPGAWYRNSEDLWIWPSEMNWSALDEVITKDTALESGEYVTLPSPGGGNVSVVNAEVMKIGSRVPNTKTRLYVKLRAVTSNTAQWWSCHVGGNVRGSGHLSITTNWAVYSFDVDCSIDTPGDTVQFTVSNPAANQAVDIAWIAVIPVNSSFSVMGLERSVDPIEPSEGEYVIWLSDGTGKGDDGDIMVGSQAGGTSNYGTLFDHSGGAAW